VRSATSAIVASVASELLTVLGLVNVDELWGLLTWSGLETDPDCSRGMLACSAAFSSGCSPGSPE